MLLFMSLALGCGDDGASPIDAGSDAGPDGPPSSCQTLGATGQFIRRAGNPRLLPGQTFSDAKIDVHIADPDVHWNAAAQRWELYYAAGHATSFAAADQVAVIRHATSTDRMTWTVDDVPALAASASVTAWDHTHTEKPTVVYNPAAPADRRYLMLYAGANGRFPHAGYTFADHAIGAAFSADGRTFTRVSAAESPHDQEGLVLTGPQVYPTGADGTVSDPEVVVVDGVYHLFFSSFSCTGADCATPATSGIAHATSTNGIDWTIAEAPVRSLLRTSALTSGGAQPSVIYDTTHCRWEMWLTSDLPGATDTQPVVFDNMAGVFHADSTDGLGWNVNFQFARELAWDQSAAGEGLGLRTGADVGANGNGRLMLYVGLDDQDVPAGFTLPNRTGGGTRAAVTALDIATRDLP